jgi:hypothetical protein|tara:strand:+ start:905 stop:1780 length:876 start_codon:yes stop_codon:yes gene_type:complete
MSNRKKHNKIKNTGILFELLTRQIAVDVMNDTKKSPAIEIIKEFFNENTQLGKENELYKVLVEKKYKSESQANILIEAVIKNRRKLSNRTLKNEKYNLIKTIKENYDVNAFFNSRISNYKTLASVYTLFENESIKDVIDTIEETDSKITILENITQSNISDKKSQNKVVESYSTEESDVRLLTYQLLVDKFNEKYSTLNESQKNLLREYINNLSNTNSLREFIDTEVTKVKSKLKEHLSKINDKITKIKLTEAIKHTETAVGGKFVKDSHVVSLMRYYELIKELDNVHNDK